MNGKRTKKSFLKQTGAITRSERSKLRALAESLRQEFEPQNPFEEFLFEKLLVDFGRLAKLYEFEKKRMFEQENGLKYALQDAEADRFLRYKNSIEKDIKDGYARLEVLKDARI